MTADRRSISDAALAMVLGIVVAFWLARGLGLLP